MKYIVEFIDHNGNVRKTQAFDCLMSAQLASIFIPLDLESRIVPAIECDPNSPYGDDEADR